MNTKQAFKTAYSAIRKSNPNIRGAYGHQPKVNTDAERAALEAYKFTHVPIICVSYAASGREAFTGFLSECPEHYIHGLHGSECYECSGTGEADENVPCEACEGSGRSDQPEYQASLFQGSQADLDRALNSGAHSSHDLSERCPELDLGDFV